MTIISKTSMKLRKAKRAELDEIVKIANRTFDISYRPFLGDDNVNWYVASGELKREIVKHLDDLYVLDVDKEIAGFIIYFNDFIHIMGIDDTTQRSGMGSFLLSSAEKELFKNNDSIKLQSFSGNKIATKFYLKNGWTKGEVNEAYNNVSMMYFKKAK